MGEQGLRRVLWLAAVANLGGAVLFAFPASMPAQLAGLPAEVPLIYRTLVALFVLLFGGCYAWLASQPVVHRPLLVLGALGKALAFVSVLLLWLADAAAGRTLLAISADLAFAALFAMGLRRVT